jgi:hypothetical protein
MTMGAPTGGGKALAAFEAREATPKPRGGPIGEGRQIAGDDAKNAPSVLFCRLHASPNVSHFRRLVQTELTAMSIESHLNELVRRHQAIEEAIIAEESHPASDDIKIHELKVKKLHIKDQIEKLKHQAETAAAH